MSGTSAVTAASRKGVAPTLLRMPRPDVPFLSRSFTLAPWDTSFRTKSRLLRLPDPLGAGSPSGSSPRFGLRTQVIVWMP